MIMDVTLTLTGAVQRLSDALASVSGVSADALAAKDVTCQQIHLQGDGGNGNPIYLGGSAATLSTSVYGARIEKATSTVPPAPWTIQAPAEGNLRCSDLYVLGTNTEKLHALLILA